ncbi:MAG: hypothetical protein ACOX8Q_00195 [Christensenellales bacterium]
MISFQSVLKDARCLIVLFTGYLPAKQAPYGKVALSSYYVASNYSYHATKKFVRYLQDCGMKAVHTVTLSAKDAAKKAGGFIGDNGFYYHDRLGSFVCIQTVLTDVDLPVDNADSDAACLHCGACSRECPSKAVGNIHNCLRYYINTLIPEALRKDVYQLFGCEKCQSACPLNSRDQSEPSTFFLDDLIKGTLTNEIKALAGTNMVSAARLLSQAVILAANTGANHLTGHIKEISEHADEPLCTHARWAFKKLTGKDQT